MPHSAGLSRFTRVCFAATVAMTLLSQGVASAEMLAVGAPMPAFELKDQEGRTVRSSELAGHRYLLWFYPKAMTPGCTKEAQSLRDSYAVLQQNDVQVLGVSFDDPAANKKFVEAESLPFRLLSDSDHKLAVAVGAASSSWSPVASRISYLVGPDGKILRAYADVDPAVHAANVVTDCCSAAAK
jgi:peroxiredoxin Q/BCP